MHVAKLVDVLISKKKRKVKEIASTSNKQDKSVDVLISKKKRKVKEIASTSNKQDKSVDVLISKKKRKVKEIASTSNKQDKSVDVLISKKKRKVKEIASTSNKQDKSVDVLISKKKRKVKEIASTSNKQDKSVDVLISKKKRKVKEIASTSNKQDKSVDVLISKKKRKVKEIASTSNKQDKSVDVLISKKKRKVKEIASTSNKEDAQSDSVEQLHFNLKELRILNRVTKKDYPRIEYFMKGMFRDVKTSITFRNITPTPLEIAIIPFPSEYVQSDTASPSITPSNIEADDVIQSPDSDDDFQDPPKSINNKGKEKTVSDSDILPTKKWVRQFVPAIPKKIPPKVVQDHDIKRPQTRNAPVSPSVKTRCVRHTKQPVVVVTKPVIK
uniref:Viral A-type inclusion protein n=1 Tax=Solanum tuberosum TaxID=4113 RepID=M1DRW0_SOLTU